MRRRREESVRFHVAEELLLELEGEFLGGDAKLLGPDDDLVVDVRQAHHVI